MEGTEMVHMNKYTRELRITGTMTPAAGLLYSVFGFRKLCLIFIAYNVQFQTVPSESSSGDYGDSKRS
jgi:hypothetical protein